MKPRHTCLAADTGPTKRPPRCASGLCKVACLIHLYDSCVLLLGVLYNIELLVVLVLVKAKGFPINTLAMKHSRLSG